jgi:multidrug resistance efflux pump
MRNVVIGAVFVLVFAGGAYFWSANQNEMSTGEDAAVHALVVELAAPVKTQLRQSSTGNPIGYNPGMVSVTLTLRFSNSDALDKARAEMRQLRRGYSNAIGAYLSKREATDSRDAEVRAVVASETKKMLGAGTVIDFDVDGQFDKPAAN